MAPDDAAGVRRLRVERRPSARLGVSLQATPDGLCVTNLDPSGLLHRAGLSVGDVILAIDDAVVDEETSAYERMKSNVFAIRVKRGHSTPCAGRNSVRIRLAPPA